MADRLTPEGRARLSQYAAPSLASYTMRLRLAYNPASDDAVTVESAEAAFLADLRAALATIDALEEALREVARQPLADEMLGDDPERAAQREGKG